MSEIIIHGGNNIAVGLFSLPNLGLSDSQELDSLPCISQD